MNVFETAQQLKQLIGEKEEQLRRVAEQYDVRISALERSIKHADKSYNPSIPELLSLISEPDRPRTVSSVFHKFTATQKVTLLIAKLLNDKREVMCYVTDGKLVVEDGKLKVVFHVMSFQSSSLGELEDKGISLEQTSRSVQEDARSSGVDLLATSKTCVGNETGLEREFMRNISGIWYVYGHGRIDFDL